MDAKETLKQALMGAGRLGIGSGLGSANIGKPQPIEKITPLPKKEYEPLGPKRTEVSTPIGDYTRISNNYYTGGDGQPWSMNWAGIDNGEAGVHAGSYGNPSSPTYFGTAYLPGYDKIGQYVPDFNKTLNTPVGSLNFESNYEIPNSVDANFTPSHYVQALINLMNRGR